MIHSTRFAERVRAAFQPTPRGVVGLVDDLMELSLGHDFQIRFQDDRCTIRPIGDGAEEAFDVPLPKSAFRAVLARIAALCNEYHPHSATPYRGEGEIPVPGSREESGLASGPCFVRFVNSPSEHRLELSSSRSPASDLSGGEPSHEERAERHGVIPDELDEADIPQSHKDELDRRLASYRENPQAASPWEDLRAKLLRRIDAGPDDAERR